MIVADKPSFDRALELWQGGIAYKAEKIGLAVQDVVTVEAKRLVQTMIKLMPPADKSELAQKIEADVTKTFQTLDDLHGSRAAMHWGETGGKHGRGGIYWYAFQSDAIFGVAPQRDLTKASAEDLEWLYRKIELGPKGRMNVGQRGKQTIYLWQRHMTKASTVRKLIARLKGHIGRLKSGWLPAFVALGSPKGTYAPPQWVLDHLDDSDKRGSCNAAGLRDKAAPSMWMENHALGCATPSTKALARDAMMVRLQAMMKRIPYLIKHPEKIAEEKA